MTTKIPTQAEFSALLARDLSLATADQRIAFEVALGGAGGNYAVRADMLSTALALPAKVVAPQVDRTNERDAFRAAMRAAGYIGATSAALRADMLGRFRRGEPLPAPKVRA